MFDTNVSANLNGEVTDKLIVTVEGSDYIHNYADLGLSFNATEREVLEATRPIIQEKFGLDIKEDGDWLFKMRKAVSSRNIHLIPNSTAGSR